MFELKQLIGLIMFIRNAYFVAHVVLFSCNFCYKMLDSAIVCYIVSDIGVFCCNLILLQPLYQCSVALLVVSIPGPGYKRFHWWYYWGQNNEAMWSFLPSLFCVSGICRLVDIVAKKDYKERSHSDTAFGYLDVTGTCHLYTHIIYQSILCCHYISVEERCQLPIT